MDNIESKVLYIEVAPGCSVETNTSHDGWVSIQIKGDIIYVNDEPSPKSIVAVESRFNETDLESQGDSYVNNPNDTEGFQYS